jgi:hypothetical protein
VFYRTCESVKKYRKRIEVGLRFLGLHVGSREFTNDGSFSGDCYAEASAETILISTRDYMDCVTSF